MNNKIISLVIFTFLTIALYSQNKAKDNKWKLYYSPSHAPISIIYQKELLFQVGQKITFAKGKPWEMISIGACAQFQFQKAFYVSPVFLVSYGKPINERIAINSVIELSRRKMLGTVSTTATPELGMSFGSTFSINYGYNIPLDNTFAKTSKHRISFRLVFP